MSESMFIPESLVDFYSEGKWERILEEKDKLMAVLGGTREEAEKVARKLAEVIVTLNG